MSAPSLPSSGDEMPGRVRDDEPARRAPRVIAPQGDLDIETSPALRAQLDALIAGGVVDIVVNCAALDYIDSAGLGTLVSALKQTANRDGALALAQPNERVSRVLRVTGLHTLFPIYDRLDQACDALSRPDAA